MKVCLPVDQVNGLVSKISPNFRSAPALLLVDTSTGDFLAIDATSGACGAMPPDVGRVVCAGGMGRGMFEGLRQRGVGVFTTSAVTVAEALAELAAGRLEEVAAVACCGESGHQNTEAEPEHGKCGCDHQASPHHSHGESTGCGCGH